METKDFISDIAFVKPCHVLDTELPRSAYVPISLDENNKELQQFDITSSQAWQQYINAYLKERNVQVAWGGYLEKRNIYKRSIHFNADNERNIHLGIDLWCDAGTEVLAVLDGEVHSFQNNTAYGDYGPTIILKHSSVNGMTFYSLYGHLSLESLKNLYAGKKVKKGEVIATLGLAAINGDYAPHLHFQLIKDMRGNTGDYPGVCSEKYLDFYRANCPDPNWLLGLE